MSRRALRFATACILSTMAVVSLAPTRAAAQEERERGVFVRLVDSAPGTVAQVAFTLRSAVSSNKPEWKVVATYDAATGAVCAYEARVLVLHSEAYANALLEHGTDAAFAVPIRLAVYSDENGTHVGATNPLNLNRTIVLEEGYQIAWSEAVDDLRAIAAAAFPDQAAAGEYGQMRKKGRIGRTMGVMAGGPFSDKVKVVGSVSADGQTVESVTDALMTELGQVPGEWDWGIRPVYAIPLPGVGAAVIGVTGERLEEDAFAIVGSGNDDARKEMTCPGVDHAPAFPIEIVVVREGGEIQVKLVGAMYRMKMFFEDAGRWKFAQNMTMPGSIEDEMKDKVRSVLGLEG